MIPARHIIAWGRLFPWASLRQVEQDLVISRALVEIFSDEVLREELRFRGGTALHKLHFPAAMRYSEDIDLVRTSAGPIGPILDRLRAVLEPWLGKAKFVQSQVAPKLRLSCSALDDLCATGEGAPRGGQRHPAQCLAEHGRPATGLTWRPGWLIVGTPCGELMGASVTRG